MKVIARYSHLKGVIISLGVFYLLVIAWGKFKYWIPELLICIFIIFLFRRIQDSKLSFDGNKLFVYRIYMWWKPKHIFDIGEIEKIFIFYGTGKQGYTFRIILKNGNKTGKMPCLWGEYDYSKRNVIKDLNSIGIDVEFQDTFFPLQVFSKGVHDENTYKSFHISKY